MKDKASNSEKEYQKQISKHGHCKKAYQKQ